MVACLNSPVATAWHRLSFRDARQRTFPQVKVGHLRTQPFPIARRSENPALHDELAARATAPERADETGEIVLGAFGLTPAEAERVRRAAG